MNCTICPTSLQNEVLNHIYRKIDTTIGRKEYRDMFKSHCELTESAVSNTSGVCFVATDEELMGYITVGLTRRGDSKHAEILQLYVFSDFRRQGVASRLLGHTIEWIESEQVDTMSVQVSPNNATAIHLYEKFGLKPATLELEAKVALHSKDRSADHTPTSPISNK